MIWKDIKKLTDHVNVPDKWEDIVSYMTSLKFNKSIKSVLRRITLAACVYHIWNERNKRQFSNEKRGYTEVLEAVVSYIRLKLTSLKVKKTGQVVEIERKWRVFMNIKSGDNMLLKDFDEVC